MARKCLDWHALFADTARKDSAQVVVKQAEACANQLGLGEAAAKLFNAVVLLRRSMKVGTGEKHQKEKGKREIQQRAFNALEEILKSRKPVVELIITDFFQTTMKSNVPGDRSSELLEQIRQLYPSKLPREPFLFERYDTIVKESPAGSEEQIRQLQLACEGEMEGYVYMHTVPSIKEYMIEVGNTWVYDAFWQEIKVDPSMVLFKLQNALGNHRHLGTYDLVPQIADKQAMLLSSLHKYMNLWHDSLKPLADQQGLYGIKDNLKAIRDVEADCKQGFPKICDLFESLLPGCIRELFDVLQRYGKRLDDKLQGRVDDIMNAFQSYKAANGLQKQAVKNVIMWDGSGTFRRALQFDFAAKAPELQMSDDEFLSAVNDLKISHEDIEVDFTDTSKAMRIISEGCLQEKPWELDAASVNGWRHKKEFTPPVVSAAASAYAVTQAALEQVRKSDSLTSALSAHITHLWAQKLENDEAVRQARGAKQKTELVEFIETAGEGLEATAELKRRLKSWKARVGDSAATVMLQKIFKSLLDLYRACSNVLHDITNVQKIEAGRTHSALTDPVVFLQNRVIGQLFVLMAVFQSPDGPSTLNVPKQLA